VFLFVGIESSGIPFPGETMLITAAAYAGAGHLRIQFVILAAIGGAVTGDNLGYWAGRTGGRSLVERYGHRIHLDAQKLQRAERFYAKQGDKTVFFGRFVAVLRAWAAFLAGLNRMPWPKFFVFNIAGGVAWATLWGVLAFEFGQNLSTLERIAKDVGYGAIVVVAIAALAIFFFHRQGHRIKERLLPAGKEPEEQEVPEPGHPS
jgi:membrane protein DedA with SNARE-associated domain